MQSQALNGIDSLLSTVQMPGGVPVGTLGIGQAGARNAALLAIAILAFSTNYGVEHAFVFYSVLAAQTVLSGIRIWLLTVRDSRFQRRMETWRRLLCATVIACGLAWGLFGASTNYVYTANAAETILVTITVLGVTISILPVLASELITMLLYFAAALGPILGLSAGSVQNLLTRNSGFVYLARTVNDATAAKVAKLNLAGIYSFNVSPEEAHDIMTEDPAVLAGLFTFEVHPCRGFPGDALSP